MSNRNTALAVAFCLPGLAALAAFPQAAPDTSSDSTPTPARVSDVYVGTSIGVYVYHAASNGNLSLVSGSPYSVAGTAIGSNHHYLLSLDPNYLHAYALASNGAIQSQVSQIDSRKYSGSDCGTAQRAVLDHSGHDVYVQIYGGGKPAPEPCVTLQSFKISSTGALSFLGATEYATQTDDGIGGYATPIRLSGTGSYAYSASYDEGCGIRMWILQRESGGAMTFADRWQNLWTPSAPALGGWEWVMAADPTNHLAIPMIEIFGNDGPCPDRGAVHLASFTVASDGSLSSTNTAEQMPTPQVYPTVLNISFSGEFLAVGGGGLDTQTPGLQVFHFNGSNPVTPYSNVLTSDPIDQIHWDRNHDLYALSDSTHKLYVYTVTSRSITAAPGSPFAIPSTPSTLSVVPVMCSAPETDGVHICVPSGGSTVASPVLVEASAKLSGSIDRMELWVDGVKKYTTHSPQVDTTVSLAAGKHLFEVVAVNTAAKKWEKAVYSTVK